MPRRSARRGDVSDDLATAPGHRAPRRDRRRHRRLQPLPRQDDRRLLRRHAAAAGHGLDHHRRADHLEAGARGDRHRPRRAGGRARGRDQRDRRGRSSSRPTTRWRPASTSRRSTTPSSAPTSPPPRPSSTSPRPSSQRQRELRQRGVIAINDLDVAQASASSAAQPGGQAHRGDEPEEPRGAVRRHHRHPAGRRRPVRRPRHRLCDAAGPRHACGSTSRCPSRTSA